jgi:hypothetical protein
MAPTILLPPSRSPATIPRASFFPLPSRSEGGRSFLVRVGSSSKVRKRPYDHQHNEKAQHTSCQWRRGKSNVTLTLNTYSHVLPEMGNLVAQAMEEVLEE